MPERLEAAFRSFFTRAFLATYSMCFLNDSARGTFSTNALPTAWNFCLEYCESSDARTEKSEKGAIGALKELNRCCDCTTVLFWAGDGDGGL